MYPNIFLNKDIMVGSCLVQNGVFCVYSPNSQNLDQESAVREYIRREGQEPEAGDIFDRTKQRPPKFKTQIKNLLTLKENDSAHFECKLIPMGDPNMKVEWFKDGEPLHHGEFMALDAPDAVVY